MENINSQETNLSVKAPMNLANMVPEEERAVEQEMVKPEVTLLGVTINNLIEDLVAEEERAVSVPDENLALSFARSKGCFDPTVGMAHIKSSLTDGLFAIIRTDSAGTRYFEYCQQYSDGSFSPMMRVAQSDLYLAASYGFLSKNISERKLRSRVESFLTKAYEDYMGKATGEELLDVYEILQLLFKARMQLPVDNCLSEALSPEEFYNQVMEEAAFLMHSQIPRKSYYVFDDGDISYLAEKMEMKKSEFLHKLKKYNFLYLTQSSKGYQTCVRFTDKADCTESGKDETYTQWRYCIFRFNNLKK